MDHEYTIEKIYHFNCSECKNWWSYASDKNLHKRTMTCPHCGTTKFIIQKSNAVDKIALTSPFPTIKKESYAKRLERWINDLST